jgi:hypothetical protein
MSNTYGGQIVQNLEQLRTIAVFHPRLALLGVAVELEVFVRETIPSERLQEIADAEIKKRGYSQERADSLAVRNYLRDFIAKWDEIPIELRRWLPEIIRRGDLCRHTRVKVSTAEAETAIANAIALIASMSTIELADAFTCKKHRRNVPFSFKDILHATESWLVKCPDCTQAYSASQENYKAKKQEYERQRREYEWNLREYGSVEDCDELPDGTRYTFTRALGGIVKFPPFPPYPPTVAPPRWIGRIKVHRASDASDPERETTPMHQMAIQTLAGELLKWMTSKPARTTVAKDVTPEFLDRLRQLQSALDDTDK